VTIFFLQGKRKVSMQHSWMFGPSANQFCMLAAFRWLVWRCICGPCSKPKKAGKNKNPGAKKTRNLATGNALSSLELLHCPPARVNGTYHSERPGAFVFFIFRVRKWSIMLD
jgi:hypothetical protein